MYKLFLASFFSLIMITTSFGQYRKAQREKFAFNYGVKAAGGSILSRPELSFIGNERDFVIYEVELARSTPQFSFGGFASKRFGWLYSEGTAMISRYGMSYDLTYYDKGNLIKETRGEKFTYVDLQVMGGITDNGFRIGVGPVIHILAGQSSELLTLENYNQVLRKISYGFSGLIGYRYGRVGFELKYDKAFRTVGDHIYYGNKKSQYRQSPDALMLQVAYTIK